MNGFPPQPTMDPDSEPFWTALRNGALCLPYSPGKGRWQWPPLERCRWTGGRLEWRTITPVGRIHSFIVQHRAPAPGFEDYLPFPIALIEPDEAPGVRLPMRVANSHGEDLRIDARVAIDIVPLPGGAFHVPLARLITI